MNFVTRVFVPYAVERIFDPFKKIPFDPVARTHAHEENEDITFLSSKVEI
jgi:hypothetical protein